MGFQNKIVTVFGGSGLIGRHLMGRLARTGALIRVASRHPSRAGFLKTAGSVGQIVPVVVDLTDDGSVARAVDGASQVINLVGILYESGRSTFQTVQAEAPGRIARAAKAVGAERLVHISAIGADPGSSAVYARTKAAGELAVRTEFPNATILRPSIVFGPDDNFFNQFAWMAKMAPALPLIGGGHTRFQPVYVGDVADAIMAALREPAAASRTYELGGPRVYTFKELMELLLAEIGRKRLLVPVPWSVAMLKAMVLEKLPHPLLTRDQVELLKTDNVVGRDALGLKDLGVSPTTAELILPTYLSRFRPGGGYSTSQFA
ncbi:MAG: sugar nucleotide-binding protein [Azospirillum sp.]|nr:sugar nucleotide-binding protein [Azospirillum sp.]